MEVRQAGTSPIIECPAQDCRTWLTVEAKDGRLPQPGDVAVCSHCGARFIVTASMLAGKGR